MARKRYKPEEIVDLLRQAEVLHGQGLSMADAIRQLGISEVTFYRWRKEYAGMSGDQLCRLKEPEKENKRLRRAVSDLTLDKQILKEAAGETSKPSRRRQCTDHVCDRLGVSERRACRVLGQHRSTQRRIPCRRDAGTALSLNQNRGGAGIAVP